MGWCSGSEIAENVYSKIRKFIPENNRAEIAKYIYEEFCTYDADCWEFSDLTRDAGEVITCVKCGAEIWADPDTNNMCDDCYFEENE